VETERWYDDPLGTTACLLKKTGPPLRPPYLGGENQPAGCAASWLVEFESANGFDSGVGGPAAWSLALYLSSSSSVEDHPQLLCQSIVPGAFLVAFSLFPVILSANRASFT